MPSPHTDRPADPSPFPLPLVGRDRELATLLALLEPTSGERLGIVTGRGGVGKTRLLDVLAEEAAWRGWRVARARAFPLDAGLPYGIFADALLPAIEEMGRDRLRILSRGADAEFAVVFPTLGPHPESARTDPEEFRGRLLWSFASFLGSLGRDRPLLLLLDDLHWADEASLALLHFLVRHIDEPGVRFVVSYNEADRDGNASWLRTERALLGLQETRVVRPEDLDAPDTRELVRRAFGVEAAVVDGFAARLWNWTRGNPWFIRQTLETLIGRGALRRRSGVWVGWDTELDDLPPSVRDVVVRRVASLSDAAVRVLDVLAVLEGSADFDLIGSLVELDEDARLLAVEELIAAGLVEEHPVDPGSARYGIPNPIVRRTLYGAMSAARVSRLHGRIGRSLEHLAGTSSPRPAHEVGRHLSRSDSAEDRVRAIRYLRKAGRDALDRHAAHEALEELRRATRLLDESDAGGDAAFGDDDRAELWALLGRSHQGVGQFRLALQAWERALHHTHASRVVERVDLLTSIGLAHLNLGDGRAALDTLSRAIEIADTTGHPQLVARVRLARGAVLQEYGRAEEARADLQAALELCGDDDVLRTRAHRLLGMLHIWTGPRVDAARHLETGLELARRIDHPEHRFWCSLGLAILESMTGAGDDFGARLEVAAGIADSLNSPLLRLRVDELRIERAYAEGRWDAAIGIGEQAIATARDLGHRAILARLLVWTSALCLERGDAERGRAYVDEACEIAGMGREVTPDIHTLVPAHIGLAHLHLVSGDWEDAIRVGERAVAIVEGTGYVLWALHRLLPILAEAHLWLDDVVGAERIGRRMREQAARLDHRLAGIFADACDAMIVWKRGDAERGIQLMRTAAEALEEAPMMPVAARIRRQMAGRLAEVGDVEGSARQLRRVHDAFLRMGLERELEKARIQFREIGARPPTRSTEGGDGLTERELEVARRVAAGGSNKTVGRELGISARTVSTHLTKIYQKLSISGRSELEAALLPGRDPDVRSGRR